MMELQFRCILAVTVSSIYLNTIASSLASPDSQAALQASHVKSNKSQHMKSIVLLRRGLKHDPRDLKVRTELFRAYSSHAASLVDKDKLEDALHYWRLALYLRPFSSEVKEKMMIAIQNKSDFDPQDFEIHKKMAEQAVSKGNYIDAIVEYRIAMQLHDDEPIRLALNNAIKIRSKDPEYMPEFDMKPLFPHNTDMEADLINSLIENNHDEMAREKLDYLTVQAPDDQRISILEDKLTRLRKKLSRDFATVGDSMLDKGMKNYARAYYSRSVETYFDPDIKKKAEALKNEPKLDFDADGFMRTTQSRIFRAWHPRGKHYASLSLDGATTILFHINKEGTISDIVVYEKEGVSPKEQAAIEAITRVKLPVPANAQTTFPISVLFTFEINSTRTR